MHIYRYLSITLLLASTSAYCQSFDRPVLTIRTDEEGVYFAGFMYWFTTQTPFLCPAEFAVLGEVVSITMADSASGVSDNIRLRVDDLVVCPESLVDAASRIRYLDTYAWCDDCAVGDSILVFMTRYEGEYAIPNWRGTNTSLGYKLHAANESRFCDDIQFLELVKSGDAWNLESLNSDELRLWRCVDSEGLLEALIRAKEEVAAEH